MPPRRLRRCVLAGIAMLGCVLALGSAHASDVAAGDTLAAIIAAQDEAVFATFNRCAEPAQLALHAAHFDERVEFYHDTGGVTWTRDAMLANTRRFACGHYTRELVAGSLQVYPVAGFGAISQGQHRFCQSDTGACDGIADFTMVWQQHDGRWRVTRVLSYGHRSSD